VDKNGENLGLGHIAIGDEVRLTEGRFAGYYATVIDCNGFRALVEFPDRAQTVAAIPSLDLVLRPAPSVESEAES
jgi:hypothetical protein